MTPKHKPSRNNVFGESKKYTSISLVCALHTHAPGEVRFTLDLSSVSLLSSKQFTAQDVTCQHLK